MGLFQTPIPNHKPVVGKAVVGKTMCILDNIPQGKYYLLACSLEKNAGIRDYFVLKDCLRCMVEERLEFPSRVLKREITSVYYQKDMGQEDLPKKYENYVANINIELDSGLLMAYDVREEDFVRNKDQDTFIHVTPESRAEVDRIFKELSAGGQVVVPVQDYGWGYYGCLVDKYGVGWEIMVDSLV